jgi:hypothetical protein
MANNPLSHMHRQGRRVALRLVFSFRLAQRASAGAKIQYILARL